MYMFKFKMVCLPTLFEKEENAPPVSKPCLLVISRNRKKAFRVYYPLDHFYYPLTGFLLYKVEWGPAKPFSTPPFFDHKSAAKLPGLLHRVQE